MGAYSSAISGDDIDDGVVIWIDRCLLIRLDRKQTIVAAMLMSASIILSSLLSSASFLLQDNVVNEDTQSNGPTNLSDCAKRYANYW